MNQCKIKIKYLKTKIRFYKGKSSTNSDDDDDDDDMMMMMMMGYKKRVLTAQ